MKVLDLVDDHSVLRSIVLSLLPGVLILLFLMLFAPPANHLGISSTLVIFTAIAVVLVPFELGYLLILGRKLNGRFSLKGIILFQEKIPIWQFFVFIPLLLLWTIFSFAVVSPKIDPFFVNNFSTWLPHWFFANGLTQNGSQNPKAVLVLTIILGFVFNGLIGPIVEELYFRG